MNKFLPGAFRLTETAASSDDRDAIWQLRHRYLANGYVPLPSCGKAEPILQWHKLEVTAEALRRWRRLPRHTTTCIRIEPPLAVFDIDVDDPIADDMKDLFFSIVGGGPRLVRRGKGFKLAIFARCEEPFARAAGRHFQRPNEIMHDGPVISGEGAVARSGGQQVEAFGGLSSRYFGAAGPHSYNDDGSVAVEYRWEGMSPLDVPVAHLPMVKAGQHFEFIDACARLMMSMGWIATTRAEMTGKDKRKPGANPRARLEDLIEALAVIPPAEGYEEWNRVGMAIWRATNGSQEGFRLWDDWSSKASNYGGTEEKWTSYSTSSPRELGAGTIFHLANKADPLWRRRSDEKLYAQIRAAYLSPLSRQKEGVISRLGEDDVQQQ